FPIPLCTCPDLPTWWGSRCRAWFRRCSTTCIPRLCGRSTRSCRQCCTCGSQCTYRDETPSKLASELAWLFTPKWPNGLPLNPLCVPLALPVLEIDIDFHSHWQCQWHTPI